MLSERTFVIRDKVVWARLLLFAAKLEFPFSCVLGPVKKPKSSDQNNRIWALHRLAADVTGHTVEFMHNHICCQFFGFTEVKSAGGIERIPLRTTTTPDKLSMDKMMELLDFTDNYYASEFGVWLELDSNE